MESIKKGIDLILAKFVIVGKVVEIRLDLQVSFSRRPCNRCCLYDWRK